MSAAAAWAETLIRCDRTSSGKVSGRDCRAACRCRELSGSCGARDTLSRVQAVELIQRESTAG